MFFMPATTLSTDGGALSAKHAKIISHNQQQKQIGYTSILVLKIKTKFKPVVNLEKERSLGLFLLKTRFMSCAPLTKISYGMSS